MHCIGAGLPELGLPGVSLGIGVLAQCELSNSPTNASGKDAETHNWRDNQHHHHQARTPAFAQRRAQQSALLECIQLESAAARATELLAFIDCWQNAQVRPHTCDAPPGLLRVSFGDSGTHKQATRLHVSLDAARSHLSSSPSTGVSEKQQYVRRKELLATLREWVQAKRLAVQREQVAALHREEPNARRPQAVCGGSSAIGIGDAVSTRRQRLYGLRLLSSAVLCRTTAALQQACGALLLAQRCQQVPVLLGPGLRGSVNHLTELARALRMPNPVTEHAGGIQTASSPGCTLRVRKLWDRARAAARQVAGNAAAKRCAGVQANLCPVSALVQQASQLLPCEVNMLQRLQHQVAELPAPREQGFTTPIPDDALDIGREAVLRVAVVTLCGLVEGAAGVPHRAGAAQVFGAASEGFAADVRLATQAVKPPPCVTLPRGPVPHAHRVGGCKCLPDYAVEGRIVGAFKQQALHPQATAIEGELEGSTMQPGSCAGVHMRLLRPAAIASAGQPVLPDSEAPLVGNETYGGNTTYDLADNRHHRVKQQLHQSTLHATCTMPRSPELEAGQSVGSDANRELGSSNHADRVRTARCHVRGTHCVQPAYVRCAVTRAGWVLVWRCNRERAAQVARTSCAEMYRHHLVAKMPRGWHCRR